MDYFNLPPQDQSDLLDWASSESGLSREAIEKDIWVCWTLGMLFRMPVAHPMAFKGGTSLSKVFDAIRRMSEDIDVSVDFRSLDPQLPEDPSTLSRSQADKARSRLQAALRDYTTRVVVPWLERESESRFGKGILGFTLDAAGEKLIICYPTAIQDLAGYLRPEVLIEFGGRNTTEPWEAHSVIPYLSAWPGGLEFDWAEVRVLSPVRTFWEKATLIHLECKKQDGRAAFRGDRISRHWSDLAALADHRIGRAAIKDLTIAHSVVRHKGAFFRDPDADYPACVSGRLMLVPALQRRRELEMDFRKMVNAGMFYGPIMNFAEIMDRLGALQDEVNESMQART
jgi:hypothetical protein